MILVSQEELQKAELKNIDGKIYMVFEELQNAKPFSEWIPVSDRLPEKEGRYITTILNEHDNRLRYVMTCVYFSNGHWCPDDESASSNVIAWMPLPKLYEPQESEDNL